MEHSKTIGPFRVGDSIDRGTGGAVYRGRHTETGVDVALKVVDRELERSGRHQFRNEVRAHARLVHPNIVYLYEYGTLPEYPPEVLDEFPALAPFVAMEFSPYDSLRSLLPVSDWETARRILAQLLDALAFAHARDVVHRDVKPANLLLFDGESERERVKLADFGVAHALGREFETATDRLTALAGTPMYMAPEQIRGEWRRYGPWTDLYAVGCLAWELASGDPPFTGSDIEGIVDHHESAPRPALDPRFEVPPALETWVHRAMAIDPRRRFRRAADARWQLPDSETANSTRPLRFDGGPTDPGAAPPEDPGPTPHLAASTQPSERERTSTLSGLRGPATDGADDAPDPTPPPLPDNWRLDPSDHLPAPLVGTGLGLFGLRDPPFVDRQFEGDRIWRALRRVLNEGRTEFVAITGKPGTGKSRLAEFFSRRAHEFGAVDVLRAHHTDESSPGGGLRRGFERLFRTAKLERSEVYDHLRSPCVCKNPRRPPRPPARGDGGSSGTTARRARHWERAGDYARALEPLSDEAERLHNAGYLDREQEVLEHRRDLLDAMDVDPTDERRLDNRLRLTFLELQRGASPEAILERSDAIEETMQSDEVEPHSRLWQIRTKCYGRLGCSEESVRCAERAVEIARRPDSPERQASALTTAGWAHYQHGNYDRAVEYLADALNDRADGPITYASLQCRRMLAHVNFACGSFASARTEFERVLDHAERLGYRRIEATAENGLGEIARFENDGDSARRHYETSLEISEQLGRTSSAALATLNLACVDLMESRFGDAERRLERARRLYGRSSGEGRRSDTIRAAQLVRAAGTERWSSFDRHADPFTERDGPLSNLEPDVPWLLEMAGDYAAQAGEWERAERVWRVAHELWCDIDDRESAAEVAEKLP